MANWFEQLMQVLLTALGLVSVPDASVLGLAVAIIAVSVLAIAVSLVILPASDRGSPHPLRAIGVSVLLSQSDPDAAGHPRPRAPGVASAA